ncbi:MAG: hypothetical protein ACHQ53_13785 [Polyangiales bacterium]
MNLWLRVWCATVLGTLVLAGCSSKTSGGGGNTNASAGTGANGAGGKLGAAAGTGAAGTSKGGASGGAAGGGTTGGAAGAAGSAGAVMGAAGGGGGAAGAPAPGMPGQIGSCAVFSADDAWNKDISKEAADATWTTRLHALVGSKNIHPDYGNSGSEHYGMPINVVPQSQPLVQITFDDYPDESDPGPYPLPDPSVAKIEGGTPSACSGDCHFLVVQSGTCMLYEGYSCSYKSGWHCGNGAKWDLSKNSYGQRPKGWTSADAAGLPITPGVLRYDEVKSGSVTHAIRFTLHCTRPNYVAPATHQAVPGSCDPNDMNAPPMGFRVRLQASYDVSGLSASAQVVARAMQRYGLILADNGSDFYFQGEDNPGWADTDVEPLKTIPASAFEAITPPPLEK